MSSDQIIEPLEKKCPRCGKPSANKSNPSGRCSSCLKKLASNKKKVGHYLHEHKVADDALRRQKGKNGTAHKKSKGLGSRKQIIKQTHAAEKKAGQVLSPDRKDNSKGYSPSNTRMVPKELNRGRHHVNEKKLRAWKKRLKKSEIDIDAFYTLMKAKATEYADTALLDLLKTLSPEGLQEYIELFDKDEDLEKGAMRRLAPKTSGAEHVGWNDAVIPSKDPALTKRGQLHLVKQHIGNKAAFKNIDGKPHIMLHRGIENYDPSKGMKLSDTHLAHDKHGLYTDKHDYAKQFSGKTPPKSVWVPIDSIDRNAHYEHGAWEKHEINNPKSDTAQYAAEEGLSPREVIEGNMDTGESMGRGNHIGVKPGRYPLATEEEVAAYLGKLEKSAAKKLEPEIPANPNIILEQIKKAKPSVKDFPNPYSFTEKGPDFQSYTGKDAKGGQISTVKTAMQLSSPTHNNIKKMINPITNKEELHILTHRGIGNKNSGIGVDPNKTGPNMVQIGDNDVSQSHHAVHTLDPNVAEEYGKRYSFWVPISQFVGTSKYINGRYKNPNDYIPSQDDIAGAIEAINNHNEKYESYEGKHPDAKTPKALNTSTIDAQARKTKYDDPHSDSQSHVVVKPGKYSRHQE